MIKIHKQKILFFLIFLMTAFIWGNSMLNANISSEQSGLITQTLNTILSKIGITFRYDLLSMFVRKLAHFGEFYLLGLFWGFYLKNKHKRISMLIICVAITAIIDESIQLFSEGRAFQVTDILIDLLGGILAFLLLVVINLKIKDHKTI